MRLPRRSHASRASQAAVFAAILSALALGVSVVVPATAAATPRAARDTSPVNLSTKINMAAGKAAHSATVTEGDARFEVLSPEVIRLEYSPSGQFLDQPTFTVLDRDFPVPPYTQNVQNGWLVLTTSDVVLRYQLGSGPFGPTNTQLQLLHPLPGAAATVSPSWAQECTFGQVCQSGAATLSGGAALAVNHHNYQSPPGFIAGYSATGASASWQLLGAPAGNATVTIRYSNYIGALGGPAPRTMSLVVNGTATQVTMAPTASWDDWATVTEPVTLQAGTNTVAVTCASGDDCNVNVDDIGVSAPGATPAPFLPSGALGGYIRSFDSTNGSYSTSPSCTGSQSGDTCQASIPAMAQGLLDTSGWYLLDDTQSAVWTSSGWLAPRPAGDVEDGYLFGYGQNYTSALTGLARLTGPAPLLPEYVFGNWLSRYYPYTTAQYEDQILPEFQANGASLDQLSVDTDWKSPNQWDGWEWNPALFPDPQAFLSWAASHDIHVTLNIHSSIATNDPEYAEAQSIAGGDLAASSCNSGPCAVWDWSKVGDAESNFALQQPIASQGVAFWWLDWCCDNSQVSMPGVTPDAWINHLYAQQMINSGERGFDLSRIGASLQDSVAGSAPTGPWADHRSAIAFTGDTWGTWNTLAMEAQLAQDEGSIGEPYISDDIGSFLGAPNGGPNDPDDLYLRWLQLGTFQPIMREHSNAGQNARLPWDYDVATQAAGDKFLQLREELVPYLYTLSQQASATGIPMAQALYLDYPDLASAYDYPSEYLLGPDMLVAPVTIPGQVATATVWFPPGTWTDWFTGATFTGPGPQTLQVPDDRMPVFVKDGGIVPLQPATGQAQSAGSAPLTLRVFDGASGRYSLYDDAGQGLGYERGQFTTTPVSYSDHGRTSTVVIGPASGSYPGAPASRSYTVDLVDTTRPAAVTVNGTPLAPSAWSYNSATSTLQVPVPATATSRPVTITQAGGTAVTAGEPAATTLTLSPSGSVVTTPGATTTVSAMLANSGPGAASGVALNLSAPAGWTVTPTTPTTSPSLGSGSSLTASWSVTAPAGPAGQTISAALSASASYTDATTGQPVSLTAQQNPTPVITSVSPSTAPAGQVVTVSGLDFGATQGDSYITFSDDGTNWGAPPDEATFSLDSWSDGTITFTVPSPSGTGGEWHVVPGSTATITVTTADGSSSATNLTIGS
jgi:alpha-glucosidase (family GH31 glycosyl hydrolase)